MLKEHIKYAKEFHVKNNLQVGTIDQFGMFERNNLLLEEIGELIEAYNIKDEIEVKNEALDVYYILLGTFVALGSKNIKLKIKTFNEDEFAKDQLVIIASQIAQATRRRYDNPEYKNEINELSVQAIMILYSLFTSQEQIDDLLKKHHLRVMQKVRRKIGDTYVISNFREVQ